MGVLVLQTLLSLALRRYKHRDSCRRGILKVVFTLTALFSFSSAALASPLTITFTGAVDSVDNTQLGLLGLSVSAGDIITGSFSYDPLNSTSDGDPSINQGIYGFNVPPASMTYTVGSVSWTADSSTLRGGYGLLSPDPQFVVVLVANQQIAVASAALVGTSETQTTLNMYTKVGVLPNDNLPTFFYPGDFRSIDFSFYRIYFESYEFHPGQYLAATAFTGRLSIPEPSGFTLLIFGLVGFVASRKLPSRRASTATP